MICVLGDLIADLVLHIQRFPVSAKGMQRVSYLDLGPGGAGNVAIAVVRLGLPVACLGETGSDRFGQVVVEGLRAEGIDVAAVIQSKEAGTPVAMVVVDEQGEPAYLGFRGTLEIRTLVEPWGRAIQEGQAFFADGWADHDQVPQIVLGGLQRARQAGVPTFFDPGPGNEEFDLGWHSEAAGLTSVLLLNEGEARRLTGLGQPEQAARRLLELGPDLVVIKRGPLGCMVCSATEVVTLEALPVPVVDTTGAGDSLDAAVICGYLAGLELPALAALANAAGAAKVQKRGTGRNVPTRSEVRAMLKLAGADPDSILPDEPSPGKPAAAAN